MKAITVSKYLGTKAADDENHLFLGFDTPDGGQHVIEMATEMVTKMALAIITSQKPQRGAEQFAVTPNWFEISKVSNDDSGDLCLSFDTAAGLRLSFRMSLSMAQMLKETLDVGLGAFPMPQSSGNPRH